MIIDLTPQQPESKELALRRKQWYGNNKLRFNKKKHNTATTGSGTTTIFGSTNLQQPREYLRKIIKDHGDMSNARYRAERNIHAGALRYIPYAIYKVFENIPQPFELQRDVKVLYHTAGAVSFVNETPRVIPPIFIAQWATMWVMMRREKHDRRNFRRVALPPFDAEEPPVDYGDNLQIPASNTMPIEIELDEVEDDAIFDWFYEHGAQPLKNNLQFVNGPSYKHYHLNVPIMANLYRLATPLLIQQQTQNLDYLNDPNSGYLFNKEAFITAKSTQYPIPAGPSFEPLFRDNVENDNWTEFNDISKLIIRRPIATEYRIALPYVYTFNPRCVLLQIQQFPLYCYSFDTDDVSIFDTLPYEYHHSYNQINHIGSYDYGYCLSRIRELERLKQGNNFTFLQYLQNNLQITYNFKNNNNKDKKNTITYNNNNNSTALVNYTTSENEEYNQKYLECDKPSLMLPVSNNNNNTSNQQQQSLYANIEGDDLLNIVYSNVYGTSYMTYNNSHFDRYYASTAQQYEYPEYTGLLPAEQQFSVYNNIDLVDTTELNSAFRNNLLHQQLQENTIELTLINNFFSNITPLSTIITNQNNINNDVDVDDENVIKNNNIISHANNNNQYNEYIYPLQDQSCWYAPNPLCNNTYTDNNNNTHSNDYSLSYNQYDDPWYQQHVAEYIQYQINIENDNNTMDDNDNGRNNNNKNDLVVSTRPNGQITSMTAKQQEQQKQRKTFNNIISSFAYPPVLIPTDDDQDKLSTILTLLHQYEKAQSSSSSNMNDMDDNDNDDDDDDDIDLDSLIQHIKHFIMLNPTKHSVLFYTLQQLTLKEKEKLITILYENVIHTKNNNNSYNNDVSSKIYYNTLECNTLNGLLLYHAPEPFNRTFGSTIPAQHINLVQSWYTRVAAAKENPQKVRTAYQKLLKHYLLTQIHAHKSKRARVLGRQRGHVTGMGFSDALGVGTGSKSLLKRLTKQTRFFQQTTTDWLEVAIQVIRQGYNALNLIIKRKRVEYLHLDYNFTLQPTRVLTTKERKHSRFGNSFHLIREILKLLKIVVDCHIRFRMGDIDAYQLADALQYTFNHVGTLTGIYRYKYRTMRQIKQTKDLKRLIYYRFNTGPVQKGPGVGFWHPSWRVWVFFLQGVAPLLEKWLNNLIARQFEGRQYGVTAQTITKQRVDTIYDKELKHKFRNEILDLMPIELRTSKARIVEQHLTEAWRCWRANIPWKCEGMPIQLENMILRFVKCKADVWTTQAYHVRERLRRGEHLEKTVVRKNLGRLTRLALKSKQQEQLNYLQNGTKLTTTEAEKIVTITTHWLEARQFITIPTPPMNYKHDTKILNLTLDKLKEPYMSANNKLTVHQKNELALLEQGYDNVDETLKRIKSMLLNARSFKEIEITFQDEYNVLTPVYTIDPLEKITDMYLDHYLWYEAHRRGLFPEWIKPSDREPPPALVYKTCQNINNYIDIWNVTGNSTGSTNPDDPSNSNSNGGGATVLMQTEFVKFYDNIDLTLLSHLLQLIIDRPIVDYIIARYNTKITYKDMNYINQVGIIRGIAFSTFVTQYYGLVIDLLILGLERAQQLAGPPQTPALYGSFNYLSTLEEQRFIEQSHPIRMYCRYLDKVLILFKLDHEDVQDITRNHLLLYPDPNNNNIHTYNTKKCWPRDCRMRLMRNDVNLGKAIFFHIKNRIPLSLTTIDWSNETTFVSVYSKDNPQLLFSLLGFEVRLIPTIRQNNEFINFSLRDNTWSLYNQYTKECTAYAYIRVEERHIITFGNKIRHMLMTSGNAPFVKLAGKWNTILTALVTYYREAITSTPELLDLLVKYENKVQTRIKVGMNSKMPQRFPPVVFYTPIEMGGLGMVSMGHILIPQSDRLYSKETSMLGTTHFRAGMSNPNGGGSGTNNSQQPVTIPVLYRYINTWENEFINSETIWNDYAQKQNEAKAQNRHLSIDDMQDMWNKGIPRINTLFNKDRQVLWYDKGWRVRLEFKKYTTTFPSHYWWTSARHDGKLWSLSNYRTDVIQALGGVESILEHTLFKATYFSSWEGVFWEQSKSTFEDNLKMTRLTKAQSQGLSQVPNRRFVLWWSPTINRGDVYIGYQVQLDLTGIFMHGKLPVLKVAYVQIFRSHLWQKIHESIVLDLCQVLDQKSDILDITNVNKEAIHPRKSYKMQSSCADITITSSYKWDITLPDLITKRTDLLKKSNLQHNLFWFDVQLRWGDYDQHDIESYTRGKYVEYNGMNHGNNNSNNKMTDGNDNEKSTTTYNINNIYPSAAGLMIGVDLAYNIWSAYGNYIPNLSTIITQAMSKIIKNNPALDVLRGRIRKQVQLYTSEPTEPYLNSTNYGELFRTSNKTGTSQCITWFVDCSAVRRVTTHRTAEGNHTTKTVNGALAIFNPVDGTLYLKIIHASVWSGQKRLAQLAKWKSVEEICALIRPLPQNQRPTQLIVTEKSLLDPLQSTSVDFPNMILKGSELAIPFQSIYKLPKIGDLITKATGPKLIVFNLYDNWLTGSNGSANQSATIQPFTCFSRLLLLLRSLHINQERARSILYPNATIITKETHLWPSYNDNEWANIERQLNDLILADFAIKNNVNVQSLTQTEIRDIILGAQIEKNSDTEQREQIIKEIENSNNANNNINAQQQTAVNISTIDQYGNEVITTTMSSYERGNFISSNDWRLRYLSTQQLYKRENVYVRNNIVQQQQQAMLQQQQQQQNGQNNNDLLTLTNNLNNLTYLLPNNLFRQIVNMSDIKTVTMGYLYGIIPTAQTVNASGKTEEQQITSTRLIQVVLIPPQNGTTKTILFTPPPRNIAAINNQNNQNNSDGNGKGNNNNNNNNNNMLHNKIILTENDKQNNKYLHGLIPLGLIYTVGQDNTTYMSPEQCVQHCEWYDYITGKDIEKDGDNNDDDQDEKKMGVPNTKNNKDILAMITNNNKNLNLPSLAQTTTITIAYTPGSCTLNSFTPTNEGYIWYRRSNNAKLDQNGNILSTVDYMTNYFKNNTLHLTPKSIGYFLTPYNKIWNYSFMILKFSKDLQYLLNIALPIDFYHYLHRKQHFLEFVKYGQQQLLIQQQSQSVGGKIAGATTAEDYSLNQLEDDFYQ